MNREHRSAVAPHAALGCESAETIVDYRVRDDVDRQLVLVQQFDIVTPEQCALLEASGIASIEVYV